MPGDLIISDAALAPAPKDTIVPAASRYIVKQVQALYTDNGAGGAWLPTLEIISDAGIVTGRYVGTSVAAGADQEVTFHPLGSKGSGGAATVAAPAWAVFTKETNMVIPTVTLTALTSTSFATSDPTVFASSPGGVSGDTTVALSGRGAYLAVGQVYFQTLGTYEHSAYVDVSPVLDNVPSWLVDWAGMLRLANTLANATTGPVQTPNSTNLVSVDVRPIVVSSTVTLPVNVQLRAQQWSGSNKNAQGRLALLYWPGSLTQTVVY